jgi:S1-C subfamily serine protease
VNTAIYSPSGASAGVGFAVPVDTVNRVVPQLISQGKYTRPSLGIEIDQDLNTVITAQLEVKGVAVLRVLPGSAAARAGLKGLRVNANRTYSAGDVITAVEGKPVNDIPELLARLDDFKIGQIVNLSILRDGQTIRRGVELQAE